MRKRLLLWICAPALILSCKKSSPSVASIDATQYYISSAKTFSPGAEGLDSFVYNSDHLLTRYSQYAYDSTSGYPQADSLIIDFVFGANSKTPSSYAWSHATEGIINQMHQLSYDGQNRITKDSSLSGDGFITNYSYPSNNLAANVQFSSAQFNNQLDTINFNNGNASSEVVYFPNTAGTADTIDGTILFKYSSYGNPAYHPEIAGTIGHLLFILSFDGFQNFVDFNSKDLATTATNQALLESISYNVVTDSKGRVSELTLPSYSPLYYRIVYAYY